MRGDEVPETLCNILERLPASLELHNCHRVMLRVAVEAEKTQLLIAPESEFPCVNARPRGRQLEVPKYLRYSRVHVPIAKVGPSNSY